MSKTSFSACAHPRAATFSPRPTAFAAQCLFALGSLGLAGSACAQATPSTDTTLPAVKVVGQQEGYAARNSSTATKTDTPLIDTPQSISVVTQKEMQDRAVQSLAEAARYIPGVGFAQGEGNRETPIFRGISTTGDFFIDGIRDDVQYYRDLYNIERVEVFRGPNAMIFGRGATGGLINRVSKQADWTPSIGGSLTLGSYANRRVTADINQPVNENLALRLNAMYEKSNSYRSGVQLERYGINPTLTWKAGRTRVSAGYEHFYDERVADRGITSYQGRPVNTDASTFFGNAEGSPTWSRLNAFSVSVEHQFADGTQLKNRTRYSDQDKFYRNVFPGAVPTTGAGAGTTVPISAYDNATSRRSLFNQTDVTKSVVLGGMKHTLLGGVELGRQETDNFRNTGYFPGSNVTSVYVPLSNPFTNAPIVYRQSASDANNSGKATVMAVYVQDQLELTRQLQLVAGLRYDQFKMDFVNNRDASRLETTDHLVSPRLGLVYKPVDAVSLYANYSLAYQPRAGDQLSSLVVTNATLAPEKFKNYEIGAKWDVRPGLSATAALFRLDRSNVSVLDPTDPLNNRTMLSDGQRTEGLELGLSGNVTSAWSVSGGYAYTDAKFVANTTAALREGARVGQVPRNTFALWNRYDFTPAFGAGLGVIHRSSMYASNQLIPAAANVELPGYTRFDAAAFYKITPTMGLQLNVENLFDKKYYVNAHSNTNIMPGSPRAVRVSLNAQF